MVDIKIRSSDRLCGGSDGNLWAQITSSKVLGDVRNGWVVTGRAIGVVVDGACGGLKLSLGGRRGRLKLCFAYAIDSA